MEHQAAESAVQIPCDQWIWFGYPAHLCVSTKCLWWMCTRVGDIIISSIGDWRPDGRDGKSMPIGSGVESLFETYVFRASGASGTEHDGSEIEGQRYPSYEAAETVHMEMCRKYAAMGQ